MDLPLQEAEGANDFARVPKVLGLCMVLDPDPSDSFAPVTPIVFFSVKPTVVIVIAVVSSLVRLSSRVVPSVPGGPRGGSSVPTILNDSTPKAYRTQ